MPKGKSKRVKLAGERMSVFYEKGNARVRLRLWPVASGYNVSAVRKEPKKDTERSVEGFTTLELAKAHLAKLGDNAVKNGWTQSFGVRGNNAALFA